MVGRLQTFSRQGKGVNVTGKNISNIYIDLCNFKSQ